MQFSDGNDLDYEDYLCHRHLARWAPDSSEALAVRQVPQRARDRSDRSDRSNPSNLADLADAERWKLYAPWLENADPAVRANALICLIHQANFLLDRQIGALEKQFWGCTAYPDCKGVVNL